MKKKIAFFTIGFAFNRLVRMKFYEKIFPKNVEIFLITTNKYSGKEKDNYQRNYDLERTKIITLDYKPLTLPFEIRSFCRKNRIDRLINLGFHTSAPMLFFSTIGTGTDYCVNVLTDIFNQYKFGNWRERLNGLLELAIIYPFVMLSKKSFFTDRLDAERAPKFFFRSKDKMIHLAAPVDTEMFKPKNMSFARKKLKLPQKKNIVIFVGRINYLKCSDILKRLILENLEIYFIVIGRLMDNIFPREAKNLRLIESLASEELVDYYNASDLSFCLNRGGGGIGLSTEEALSCGIPVMVSQEFELKKSKALYQIPVNFEESQKAMKDFFELNKKVRIAMSKEARKYVKENYSDNSLMKKYLKSYLFE